MATTNNPDYATLMRSIMNHGRNNIYISCSDDQNKSDDTFDEIIQKRFEFVNPGHSFRCTEMESALGIGQLKRKDELSKRRLEIAAYYTKELSSLRTGRANASMLDLIKVEVYGQQTPINQIGSVTTPESRMINIQVWDANNVQLVDAAIKKSDLGLNPQIDGQLIRLPVPELNEERRTELKKLIKSIGEKCKVSIRNIRREANEVVKKLLKDKEISEDDEKSFEKNVQNITDKHIQIVDEKVSSKEKEIMTI